eukprot:GHVR01106565.1.p1 GENE.GHVR01106565.1~~GHVR01106565.1.p1  ORF type:complete len:348 (+),score=60.19 GHVR01106565.1:39-1082(+)
MSDNTYLIKLNKNTCAYCYKSDVKLSTCSKCKKRQFCSKECQVKDWKTGHKHWCGVSGEIGHDYEVRESQGKGLGLFALRKFEKNEKIMMERPLITIEKTDDYTKVPYNLDSAGEQAITQLLPEGGSIGEKFDLNRMGVPPDRYGLFVTMARINHDCRGNCDQNYSIRLGVQILVARRTIMEGEEFTFNYFRRFTYEDRIKKLRNVFNFICDCYMCRDTGKDMRDDYDNMIKYDEEIYLYIKQNNFLRATIIGKMLLELYKKHEESSVAIYRTCLDIYQCAITRQITFEEGKLFAREAYDNIRNFVGDDDDDDVTSMRHFAENPERHVLYLISDLCKDTHHANIYIK